MDTLDSTQIKDSTQINRKKFLQICGSVLAGVSIAALSTLFIRRMYAANSRQSIACDGTVRQMPGCSGCSSNCPSRN